MPSFVSLSVIFCLISGIICATLWTTKNCNSQGGLGAVYGTVTDAICCNNTVTSDTCGSMSIEQCGNEDTCHWSILRNKCGINRDEKNNVCCQAADLQQNCVDMMAGRCPAAWQIPHDCCPDPFDKYKLVLATNISRPDLVCCNAPCTAIEYAWRGNWTTNTPGKTQCTAELSVNCAPDKKGYMEDMMAMAMGGGSGYRQQKYGQHGGSMGGMDLSMLSQLMGMPVHKPMSVGKVMGGMGGGLDGGEALKALEDLGYGSSRDDHVDEITVDDFFDAIIESLDNDKDVFEYNKEINSDSWFGKQSFGGLVDGFNFINPTKFINQIYGSPFGLSNAQAMYGMQYGISQDKFKTPTHDSSMTGFQPASSYGSHYSFAPLHASPYRSPSYGPPTPPNYAPPTPPAFYAPPPPPYPEQTTSDQPVTDAPVNPEKQHTAFPEQPPYNQQQQPSYPQQQQPLYPQQQQSAFSEQPPTYPEQPPTYPEQPPTYPEQSPTYPEQPPTYPEQPPTYPEQPHTYPELQHAYPEQSPTFTEQPPAYSEQIPPSKAYPGRPSYPQQRPTYPEQSAYQARPKQIAPNQSQWYGAQSAYRQPLAYPASASYVAPPSLGETPVYDLPSKYGFPLSMGATPNYGASGPSYGAPPSFEDTPVYALPSNYGFPLSMGATPDYGVSGPSYAAPASHSPLPPSYVAPPPSYGSPPSFEDTPVYALPSNYGFPLSMGATPKYGARGPSYSAPPSYGPPQSYGSGSGGYSYSQAAPSPQPSYPAQPQQ